MPDFTLFILGALSPFVFLALWALIDTAHERYRKWRAAPKGIPLGTYARCPRVGCGYDCASYLDGRRRQRKSTLRMLEEHIAAIHPKEASA